MKDGGIKYLLPGSSAKVELAGPKPRFVFSFANAVGALAMSGPGELVLLKLAPTGDGREAKVKWGGASGRGLRFGYEETGAREYDVIPDDPLAPGEYAFYHEATGRFFDFKVVTGGAASAKRQSPGPSGAPHSPSRPFSSTRSSLGGAVSPDPAEKGGSASRRNSRIPHDSLSEAPAATGGSSVCWTAERSRTKAMAQATTRAAARNHLRDPAAGLHQARPRQPGRTCSGRLLLQTRASACCPLR